MRLYISEKSKIFVYFSQACGHSPVRNDNEVVSMPTLVGFCQTNEGNKKNLNVNPGNTTGLFDYLLAYGMMFISDLVRSSLLTQIMSP